MERVVWSPASRTCLAVGSHGGDVVVWDYACAARSSHLVHGCGKVAAAADPPRAAARPMAPRALHPRPNGEGTVTGTGGMGGGPVQGGAINDMRFARDGTTLYAVGHDGSRTPHPIRTPKPPHACRSRYPPHAPYPPPHTPTSGCQPLLDVFRSAVSCTCRAG